MKLPSYMALPMGVKAQERGLPTLLLDAHGGVMGMTETQAEAEYITNAVNSHDALVEALEGVMEFFSEVAGDCCDPDQADAEEAVCNEAMEALAAAKGAEQ